MVDPGFEIYAAPFDVVFAACNDEASLGNLRRGVVTKEFVHFAPTVGAAEILHLANAVNVLSRSPVDFDFERRETDISVIVDRLNPSWVRAVSSLSDAAARDLQNLWIQAFLAEEKRKPDWTSSDQTDVLIKFIQLCRQAIHTNTDVIMVWFL
jgi:hypothetical protein